eukprot:1117081-Rhodomonas_salina.1
MRSHVRAEGASGQRARRTGTTPRRPRCRWGSGPAARAWSCGRTSSRTRRVRGSRSTGGVGSADEDALLPLLRPARDLLHDLRPDRRGAHRVLDGPKKAQEVVSAR